MHDGDSWKPIGIQVCRTKVKVTTSKNKTKNRYFFVSARYLKNEMSFLNESLYTHAWW